MPGATIRLVVADDHPLILDGLEHLFRQTDDLEIVERCATGEEALRAVERHRPDVLVLDVRMPGLDGLTLVREMQRRGLDATRVILLTGDLDERTTIEAVRLGVGGVVLKEMAPRLLIQCIRKVHAGERWVETRSVQAALEKALLRESGLHTAAGHLTAREIELIRSVAEGLRNREIAERLGISEGTVKSHLYNIYKKLDIETRVGVRRYAEEKGLV